MSPAYDYSVGAASWADRLVFTAAGLIWGGGFGAAINVLTGAWS